MDLHNFAAEIQEIFAICCKPLFSTCKNLIALKEISAFGFLYVLRIALIGVSEAERLSARKESGNAHNSTDFYVETEVALCMIFSFCFFFLSVS